VICRTRGFKVWTLINCPGLGIFLFSTAARPALGPTQPPIQWVPEALSLGVKMPRREADYSRPYSDVVKNAWRYNSTSQYVFLAWCLVKHRGTVHLPMGPQRLVYWNLLFWDDLVLGVFSTLSIFCTPRLNPLHVHGARCMVNCLVGTFLPARISADWFHAAEFCLKVNSRSGSQEILRLLWNPKFNYLAHKVQPPAPNLSQMNRLRTLFLYDPF
jgi:hypothetical protein